MTFASLAIICLIILLFVTLFTVLSIIRFVFELSDYDYRNYNKSTLTLHGIQCVLAIYFAISMFRYIFFF